VLVVWSSQLQSVRGALRIYATRQRMTSPIHRGTLLHCLSAAAAAAGDDDCDEGQGSADDELN